MKDKESKEKERWQFQVWSRDEKKAILNML